MKTVRSSFTLLFLPPSHRWNTFPSSFIFHSRSKVNLLSFRTSFFLSAPRLVLYALCPACCFIFKNFFILCHVWAGKDNHLGIEFEKFLKKSKHFLKTKLCFSCSFCTKVNFILEIPLLKIARNTSSLQFAYRQHFILHKKMRFCEKN